MLLDVCHAVGFGIDSTVRSNLWTLPGTAASTLSLRKGCPPKSLLAWHNCVGLAHSENVQPSHVFLEVKAWRYNHIYAFVRCFFWIQDMHVWISGIKPLASSTLYQSFALKKGKDERVRFTVRTVKTKEFRHERVGSWRYCSRGLNKKCDYEWKADTEETQTCTVSHSLQLKKSRACWPLLPLTPQTPHTQWQKRASFSSLLKPGTKPPYRVILL